MHNTDPLFYFCSPRFHRDEDLLDGNMPEPTVSYDALIDIALIQLAAEELRDFTSFLGDFEALDEVLPVVKSSVNDVIAGPDRTLADLFDFTDWANNLEGSPTDTVSAYCIFHQKLMLHSSNIQHFT